MFAKTCFFSEEKTRLTWRDFEALLSWPA